MSWYNEAIFYHIYPLGLTGAPKHNDYSAPVSRLNTLLPWIDHIREIGCTALYIGPLFESVGHGYETTDYKKPEPTKTLKTSWQPVMKKRSKLFSMVYSITQAVISLHLKIFSKTANIPDISTGTAM